MPTGGFINQWGEFEMYNERLDKLRDFDDSGVWLKEDRKDCSTCKYRDIRFDREECTRCHLEGNGAMTKWVRR